MYLTKKKKKKLSSGKLTVCVSRIHFKKCATLSKKILKQQNMNLIRYAYQTLSKISCVYQFWGKGYINKSPLDYSYIKNLLIHASSVIFIICDSPECGTVQNKN